MSQNEDSASTQQQQQPSFLQESNPPTAQHHHDAFGEGDSGIDYGDDAIDFEEGDYDSVNGSQGDPLNLNANGIPNAINSSADYRIGINEQSIETPADAQHSETIDLTTTLDELQEEVGLHETTLSTLHSKLLFLSSEIEAEEANAESLRGEIQTLSQRKLRLKKKTEGNIELVRRVEGTLEKTLGRLKSALGQPEYVDKDQDVHFQEGKIGSSAPSIQEEAAVASIEHEIDLNSKYQQAYKAESSTATETDTNKSRSSCIRIPLHQDSKHEIQWSTPNEAIRSKIKQILPTWRTNLPTPSLWGAGSTDVLSRLVSILSNENLLERQDLVDKGLLPADSGWVNESCIIGTPLDIYKHVDCKRWLHTVNSPHTLNEKVPAISRDNRLDPNAVLCPYELGGVCADYRCPYQHLGRPPTSSAITLGNGRRYLRYYALPEVRTPPPLSRDDFVASEKDVSELITNEISSVDGKSKDVTLEYHSQNEDGPAVTKVYPCPTCATVALNVNDLRAHMQQCNPNLFVLDGTEYTVQNVLVDESKTNDAAAKNDQPPGHHAHIENDQQPNPVEDVADASAFIDNQDMVCLPTIDHVSDSDSCDESVTEEMDIPSRGFLFDEQYWWQALIPRANKVSYASCHQAIDFILLSFGFEPVRDDASKVDASHLRLLRCSTLQTKESKSLELQEIILNARIIDFCQICVHMGQCSLGLSLLRSAIQSKENEYHLLLLQHVFDSVKAASTSRGACDLFTSQVRLSLVSQFYQLRHAWLSQDIPKRNKEPRVEQLLAILDENKESLDHDIKRCLSSRIPSSCGDTGQSGWEDFVSCLQLQLEKYIIVPFAYKMTETEQLSFLLECANIGRVLQDVMGNVHDRTFSPLAHVLDPVWAVVQLLLQTRQQKLAVNSASELRPHLLVILVIGPLVFECSSNIISRPLVQTGAFDTFDTRDRLDLSTLDKSIIEMIKDVRRCWRNRDIKIGNIECLLSPLYMMSVSICVCLGAFEKAQLRLSNAINAKSKFQSHSLSMNAISESLYSQLIHLRMSCPTYTDLVDPRGECETRNLVAQATFNGIVLCRLDACGDLPMISAANSNRAGQQQWQNLSSVVNAKHQSEYFEFEASHPKIEITRSSEFPRSLLVAGQTMKCLRLVGCMLDDLPLSIGVHLSSLVVRSLSHIFTCQQGPQHWCFSITLFQRASP